MKPKYSVIVSNIGTVERDVSYSVALYAYMQYVNLSQSGRGRAAGETVTMVDDRGEIVKEHIGEMDLSL
jgi:hypothetical protein